MGWIAQNKIKIKIKKRKEGLKEEDRRDQTGERLIFYIQRTSRTLKNIREPSKTSQRRTIKDIREEHRKNFQVES